VDVKGPADPLHAHQYTPNRCSTRLRNDGKHRDMRNAVLCSLRVDVRKTNSAHRVARIDGRIATDADDV
jgi:hypothetical protein